MKKNPHGKILRWEPKKQHLSTVSKSYPLFRIFPKKKNSKILGGPRPPSVLKWLYHYLKLFSISSKDQLANIFTESHPKRCLRALINNLKLVSHPL